MQPFTELEFISRLNLRNCVRHSKGFNFSCPICNEGSHPNKKRGFILLDDGRGFNSFYCHNGCPPMSIKNFIEYVDPILFDEYLEKEKQECLDSFKNGKVFAKKISIPKNDIRPNITIAGLKLYTLNPKFFKPVSEIKEALDYCRQRKIPDDIIEKLKYCIFPPETGGNHILNKMLIFPCYYDEDRIYAFQGRSITGKIFFNHFPNDSFKVYNIFGIDSSKDVYIFESIIDSFCTPNSIAALGTSLSDKVLSLLPKRVWVTDNDCAKKGKKDVKGIEKALQYAVMGERVVVYPSDFYAKDTNEAETKYKLTKETIQDIIKNNTFSGMMAIAKLKFRLSRKR